METPVMLSIVGIYIFLLFLIRTKTILKRTSSKKRLFSLPNRYTAVFPSNGLLCVLVPHVLGHHGGDFGDMAAAVVCVLPPNVAE